MYNTQIKTIQDLYDDLTGLLPRYQVEDLIHLNKLRILRNMQQTKRNLQDTVTGFLLAIERDKEPRKNESIEDIHAYKLIARHSLVIAYQTLKAQEN